MKLILTWAAVLALCLPSGAAEVSSGLVPIYLLTNGLAFQLSPSPGQSSPKPTVAFRAICTNEWLPGLVPVFGVARENHFELRRRPVRGQESSSEPLFFALPNLDEPEADRVAGRWDVVATRGDKSKAYFAWELASEGYSLAGRFEQNTDYRFAHINGGSFRSNRVELRTDYISDAFVLTGHWQTNRLQGEWHRTDDAERGTWQAERPFGKFISSEAALPLYEWRNPDGQFRYALETEPMTKSWQRSARPLCRVWK